MVRRGRRTRRWPCGWQGRPCPSPDAPGSSWTCGARQRSGRPIPAGDDPTGKGNGSGCSSRRQHCWCTHTVPPRKRGTPAAHGSRNTPSRNDGPSSWHGAPNGNAPWPRSPHGHAAPTPWNER
ncbi:hypothetical protein AAFF_G00385630 [Aldrovandia affinis]|uniref:Uncharacterized protein n=1 Tax=Aldrovandia affinis TaxID=143900 RepID=A0AAD7SFG5_9TELE|nr:hypothetical protein AAFF_G00385630 [Aldrovandia affinis]